MVVFYLVSSHNNLQECDQIFVEIRSQDPQAWLYDSDSILNDLIKIIKFNDDILNEVPNLLKKLDIRVLLSVSEFLASFQKITDKELIGLNLVKSNLIYVTFP
jgi:hypothetical protein